VQLHTTLQQLQLFPHDVERIHVARSYVARIQPPCSYKYFNIDRSVNTITQARRARLGMRAHHFVEFWREILAGGNDAWLDVALLLALHVFLPACVCMLMAVFL